MRNTDFLSLIVLLSCVLWSCQNDDDSVTILVDNPSSYEYFRANESSVSTLAQMDRANQITEISNFLLIGDAGEIIEASLLKEAFRNDGQDGAGFFSFSSDSELQDQVFAEDLQADFYGDLFEQAAIASKAGDAAENGRAGIITREIDGSSFLVNRRGHQLSQFFEKGLMGGLFLHQIFNTHLAFTLSEDEAENILLVSGTNFTALEHQWDQAFGYFTAPGDFGSSWPAPRVNEISFWSHYANQLDPVLGISDRIMDAYRDGREAIVTGDLASLELSRDILYSELEILAAAAAIHHINLSMTHQQAGQTAELFHNLSQAYMFSRALTYSPRRVITLSMLHNIQNVDFGLGGNFWTLSENGLADAKLKLVDNYPMLEEVMDEL